MRIGIGLSIGRFRPSVLTAALIFRAPLQTNILMTRGAGTPTFTRASTATVVDFEGVVRLCKSGEARMQGMRRVENLQVPSTGAPTSVWATVNANTTNGVGTIAYAPGHSSVTVAKSSAITGARVQKNITTTPGNVYTSTVRLLKPASFSGDYAAWFESVTGYGIVFNPYTGVISSASVQLINYGVITDPTNPAFWRVHFTVTAGSIVASGFFPAYNSNGSGAESSAIGTGYAHTVDAIQLENVTGQSIQTPAEYISTGVLSYPFHGTAVDGVKYFETRLDGTIIPKTATSGYLNEPQRTNLLLNSDVPVTQNITTTAAQHTISMWGTGTCTLSGTATGTLTGTGAGNRVQLTVTPTAGTLTLTFAGSNTKGQAELGASASSYIPTTTAAAVRAADSLAMPVSVVVGPVNRLFWCSDYTQSSWTKQSGAMSVTGTGKLDPLGTFTAQEVTWTGFGSLYQSQANFIGEQQTGVIWIKGTAGQAISVWFDQPSGLSSRTRITLTGSWQLFTCVTPAADTTSVGSNFAIRRDSASDTATVVNLWRSGGFIGNVTPAEIPLTTTAPNANSQGTMVVTLSAPGPDAAGRFPSVSLDSGLTGNSIVLAEAPGLANSILVVNSGGTARVNYNDGLTLTAGAQRKFAVSWNNGRVALAINGNIINTWTGITMPLALSRFITSGFGYEWFGTITTPQVYSQALSDATLRALTA